MFSQSGRTLARSSLCTRQLATLSSCRNARCTILHNAPYNARSSQTRAFTVARSTHDGGLKPRPDNFFFDDVLAGGPAPPVQVDAVLRNGRGFQLSTGVEVGEAIFILNGEGLLWRPAVKLDKKNILTIDLEAFGILDVSAVKPDMLIIGTGLRNEFVSKTVRDHLHALGIQVDTMDTRNAASTFNVLAAEGRSVACALLPA